MGSLHHACNAVLPPVQQQRQSHAVVELLGSSVWGAGELVSARLLD